MKPTLIVDRDYGGYFEELVRSWIERKKDFRHRTIRVTAAPYMGDAVSYRSSNTILYLVFYSALRCGFGQLSKSDIDRIVELL